jgi:PhnB protein
LFNGLSAGGVITMPLEKSFWGSFFGMFNDKYGIQWMINYEFK